MFVGLSIRNIVLIEQLALGFDRGLTVLTGETGAGKSILLDALGLALGARADSALVRQGAAQASVAAEFALAETHPVRRLLRENDVEAPDEVIVLRRVLQPDGRSRAYVADQPVSIGLLRQVGAGLVEIHGQFETQGLLDPKSHRDLLDAFAGNAAAVAAVRDAWSAWRACEAEAEAARRAAEAAAQEADYLRHAAGELEALAPEAEEEAALAEQRQLMQGSAKLLEGIETAAAEVAGDRGAERALASAQRGLARLVDRAQGTLDPALDAISRALDAVADAERALADAADALAFDPGALERLEERLFALRGAARKHGVPVDALPALRRDLSTRLEALANSEANLAQLGRAAAAARDRYDDAAAVLTAARRTAAASLDGAVMRELAPLRLGRARFATEVTALPGEGGGAGRSAEGREAVMFTVATNPDSAAGPLHRIASGGELARFMLALKVVLSAEAAAGDATPPAMVFDEVDSGVGGAVAAAVGARLRRLGRAVQVFAVTHNPQVAARAHHHLRVSKGTGPGGTATVVEHLDPEERREEIARMLSGATVTPEARAAADALLTGEDP